MYGNQDSQGWRSDPFRDHNHPGNEPRWLPSHRSDGSGVRRRVAAKEPVTDDDRLFQAFLAEYHRVQLPRPIDAIRFALRLLRDLIPSEVAFASLYDTDADVLRIVCMHPEPPIRPGPTMLSTRVGLVARALAAVDPPLRLADGQDGERLSAVDGAPGVRVRNAIYQPLRHDGRLLGLVHMVNRHGPSFSDGDASLVSYVGDHLTEQIHQAC